MDDLPNPHEDLARRAELVDVALVLVVASVCWGAFAGGVSIALGILDHSLGVLAVGLNVLADLAGSATLIWRFRAERRSPLGAGRFEEQATTVVAAALAVASVVLIVEAAHALLIGSHPGTSPFTLAIAAASVCVLAPLAVAKRRVGRALESRALRGDGALSAVGAASALFALVGLVLYQQLGLWWADRLAALVIAAVAGVESFRTARGS